MAQKTNQGNGIEKAPVKLKEEYERKDWDGQHTETMLNEGVQAITLSLVFVGGSAIDAHNWVISNVVGWDVNVHKGYCFVFVARATDSQLLSVQL